MTRMKLKHFIPIVGMSEFYEDYANLPKRDRNPFLLVCAVIIQIQILKRLGLMIGTIEYAYIEFFATK